MGYCYNKLRGRIVEKYGTQSAFARDIGLSKTSLSKKMTGKTGFSQEDVRLWRDKLDITDSEIGTYFFCESS